MYILGINAYHGDAAAAIVRDGELLAAVEEERLNRIKHCAGFPIQSIEYCLRAAGISIAEVDHVGISRNPSANLHKKLAALIKRAAKSGHATMRRGAGVSTESDLEVESGNAWEGNGNGKTRSFGLIRQVGDRLRNVAKVRDVKSELALALGIPKDEIAAEFHNIEHHRAHLASSFFVSPFSHAALLSLDGFGDFISTMSALGEGNSIKVLGQIEYPHSLGILYTATTQFIGFPYYGDEGKVMGLAPYGEPRFIRQLRDIVRTEPHGKFSLNLDYFLHASEGVDMSWDDGSPFIGRLFSDQYENIFGPPRPKNSPLTDRDRDLATSLQLRLEEVAFHVLNHLHDQTGLTDLGLSGGVTYNSVMNGKILRHTPFRRVFIQPAAGDSGTAVGVCYQIWNDHGHGHSSGNGAKEKGTSPDRSSNTRLHCMSPYTGPEFSDDEIRAELERANLEFEFLSDQQLLGHAAEDIANGLVVGWFQGRMEFGPRALGNRSILADPTREPITKVLNERIKKRESFRPFAPSILAEYVSEYFEETHPSPAMLMVHQIKPERRAVIPAVTHVDGSGRLQTVTRNLNSRYYDLIRRFYEITGVPVVLNTSFNENEPIVCTPRDAVECFLKTKIDVLYLGNFMTRRTCADYSDFAKRNIQSL